MTKQTVKTELEETETETELEETEDLALTTTSTHDEYEWKRRDMLSLAAASFGNTDPGTRAIIYRASAFLEYVLAE